MVPTLSDEEVAARREADRLAEALSRRMKWDALWWFLAAVAVSVPVGIFVNSIS